MQDSQNAKAVDQMRRTLLSWAPPVVAAITLPAHAQTSVCGSMPRMVATVASKCAGDPPVGEAIVSIFSDAADSSEIQLEIRAITVNGAAATDSFTLPALPANVIDSVGIEIGWNGNATDAVTCLPLSMITIEVVYACDSASADQTVSFNFTEVLADAT